MLGTFWPLAKIQGAVNFRGEAFDPRSIWMKTMVSRVSRFARLKLNRENAARRWRAPVYKAPYGRIRLYRAEFANAVELSSVFRH